MALAEVSFGYVATKSPAPPRFIRASCLITLILTTTPPYEVRRASQKRIDVNVHAVTPGSVGSCVERAGALAHAWHASVGGRFPMARCVSSETLPHGSSILPGLFKNLSELPEVELKQAL